MSGAGDRAEVAALHLDRSRAESFGADAERYERARPGYPDALVDALVAGGRPRVLDVGCGTGKVARRFAERGCDVLGVEPDARMAAVARGHGVAVEVGHIERWDPAGRVFDLVVSGQAWHWVDPVAGPAAAASVLAPGGQLGVFWNVATLPDDVRDAMSAAYRRLGLTLDRYAVVLGNAGPERYASAAASLRVSPGFGEVTARSFEHRVTYTTAGWLDQLMTHSDHAALAQDEKERLAAAVGAVVDGVGGRLDVRYDTWLVTAARRGYPARGAMRAGPSW